MERAGVLHNAVELNGNTYVPCFVAFVPACVSTRAQACLPQEPPTDDCDQQLILLPLGMDKQSSAPAAPQEAAQKATAAEQNQQKQ